MSQSQLSLSHKLSTRCDSISPCYLHPQQLFIAWHGVITLVFRAFPEPICSLKRVLNTYDDLPPEGAGSRWPKMTLAALSPGERLESEELDRLLSLTKRYHQQIQDLPPLAVTALSIVEYERQSLEVMTRRERFKLSSSLSPVACPPKLQTEVAELIADQVEPISEVLRHKILSPGRDVSHYRQEQRGSSLVIEAPHAYQECIRHFSASLEALLPKRYQWFTPESRHVTIRALS